MQSRIGMLNRLTAAGMALMAVPAAGSAYFSYEAQADARKADAETATYFLDHQDEVFNGIARLAEGPHLELELIAQTVGESCMTLVRGEKPEDVEQIETVSHCELDDRTIEFYRLAYNKEERNLAQFTQYFEDVMLTKNIMLQAEQAVAKGNQTSFTDVLLDEAEEPATIALRVNEDNIEAVHSDPGGEVGGTLLVGAAFELVLLLANAVAQKKISKDQASERTRTF
jgi:hypothetical protein